MKNTNAIIGIIGFTFIFVYILAFSTNFTYDEPYYLSNLEIIDANGAGEGFLKVMKGPAGPLHAYLHYVTRPITQLTLIPTRLINLILCIGIFFSLYKTLKLVNPERKDLSFLFFAIPMVYPCAAMALTEIPAMLFFALSLWLIAHLFMQKEEKTNRQELIGFVFAGILLSIAVAGRQPYLVCIGGLAPLVLLKNEQTRKLGIILFSVAAVIIPVYLFYVWGGLAPKEGGTIATREFLKPIHFFLGLGYAFMIMGILSPHFFIRPTKKIALTYAALLPVVFVINILVDFSFMVAATNVERLLPASLLPYFGYLMAAILIITGLFFMHSLFQRAYEKKEDQLFLALSIMLLFLLFSNISITHLFSSRYVFQAAPLFIILASYFYKKTKYSFLLPSFGILMGAFSIYSYYSLQ